MKLVFIEKINLKEALDHIGLYSQED